MSVRVSVYEYDEDHLDDLLAVRKIVEPEEETHEPYKVYDQLDSFELGIFSKSWEDGWMKGAVMTTLGHWGGYEFSLVSDKMIKMVEDIVGPAFERAVEEDQLVKEDKTNQLIEWLRRRKREEFL